MLCVECGAEVPKTIGGSCPACFTRKTPLLQAPDVLDVELCAHCDARRVGAHWVDPAEGMPLEWIREDAVRGAVSVHHRVEDPYLQFDEMPQDDKHFLYGISLEGMVEGAKVTATVRVQVRQKRGVCDRCSRMHGDYYAAIVQLRATEREVTSDELGTSHRVVAEELRRQMESGNRFAFLTKEGPIHGGWDYYIGDIEGARQVCRVLKQRLGATAQETAKLVGRREGEDVHRVTFLVRIRLFAPGDFALWQGKTPVQVLSLAHGKAICLELLHHRRTRVDETDLKRLGGAEIVQEAVLVSSSETDLQLLDPVTYRTEDTLRPDGFVAGETVPVLRHDERMYVVPPTHTPNKS